MQKPVLYLDILKSIFPNLWLQRIPNFGIAYSLSGLWFNILKGYRISSYLITIAVCSYKVCWILAYLIALWLWAWLESLEIACRRFRKCNSKYIESIKIARRHRIGRYTVVRIQVMSMLMSIMSMPYLILVCSWAHPCIYQNPVIYIRVMRMLMSIPLQPRTAVAIRNGEIWYPL